MKGSTLALLVGLAGLGYAGYRLREAGGPADVLAMIQGAGPGVISLRVIEPMEPYPMNISQRKQAF